MLLFVARRLLYLVPVLIAVSVLTFVIASLLPGDLAYVILGDQATPENVAALRHDMGLDQPIWLRYLGWLWHILQGDFGRSFRTGQTVWQAVSERIPVSFELMILAELIGLESGYRLERLSGRYLAVEQQNLARHGRVVLSEKPLGMDIWQSLQLGQRDMYLVEAQALRVDYMPIADGASYAVELAPTGLLARPLNAAATEALKNW